VYANASIFSNSSYEIDGRTAKNVVTSRFHVILLDDAGLYIVDRFDWKFVGRISWNESIRPLRLFGDSKTFWVVLNDHYLYEAILANDDAGVWKKFIELECFELALQYCPVSSDIEGKRDLLLLFILLSIYIQFFMKVKKRARYCLL
jgi:hypothetical protein